jgi:hypothetical protein
MSTQPFAAVTVKVDVRPAVSMNQEIWLEINWKATGPMLMMRSPLESVARRMTATTVPWVHDARAPGLTVMELDAGLNDRATTPPRR